MGLRIPDNKIAVNLCRKDDDRRHVALNVCVGSVSDVGILTLGVFAFIPLPDFKNYALLWCILGVWINHEFAKSVLDPTLHPLPLGSVLHIG